MTMTTRDPLICECGHTGAVRCRENDQPYSSMWESYTLEGFEGGSFTLTSERERPPNLLDALAPRCPACGHSGRVRFKPA